MHILISAYECDPTRGSENSRAWSWVLATAEEGHTVTCLTSEWGRPGIEAHLPMVPYGKRIRFVYVAVPRWLEQQYEAGRGIWVYVRYLFWQRQAWKQAKVLDRTSPFDAVHHISWGSIQQGTSLWRLRKPLLFGPTGGGQFAPDGFQAYFGPAWSFEKRRAVVSRIMQRCFPDFTQTMRRARLVLVVNHETHEMAVQGGAKHVQPFVDINLRQEYIPKAFPQKSYPDEALRLLWVGRLMPRKALNLVLEALSHVPADVPWHLTVIGDGEMGAYLPDWLDTFGLASRVTWKGQVPFAEVRAAYLEHDAFIFCSLRDSSADQFCEAMAHGMPILTLDIHGGTYIVPDDGGIKIPVTTPHETIKRVADAVTQLQRDPNLREKLGRAGYRHVTQTILPAKRAFLRSFYTPVSP